MGHYVKRLYVAKEKEKEPEKPIFKEEKDFLRSTTEYEKWQFNLAFSAPFKALQKLKEWRAYLPDFFNSPLNDKELWPPGVTAPIDIPPHWLKKPVHFLGGGYANNKNVRISYAANEDFYFTREEPVRYWLDKVHRQGYFKKESPQKILDIGCGTGVTTFQFADLFHEAKVIGIDLGAPFVRFCRFWKEIREQDRRSFTKNVEFYQQNGEKTNWEDGSFDIVHVTYVLHEMPGENAKRMLSEAYRLLKPGGVLSIMDVSYSKIPDDRKKRVDRGTFRFGGLPVGTIVGLITGLFYKSRFYGPEPFLNEYMNKFVLPQAIIDGKFIELHRHYENSRYYFTEDDGHFVTAIKPETI